MTHRSLRIRTLRLIVVPGACFFAGCSAQSAPVRPAVPVMQANSTGGSAPSASIPVAPPANVLEFTWADNAIALRTQIGQSVRIRCSPRGTASVAWGTDVYSVRSSVCTAALHAGRASLASGGEFEIEIRPPADGYAATLRNGVASRDLVPAGGDDAGSFAFVGGPAPGLYAAPLDAPAGTPRPDPWSATATSFRGQNGTTHAIDCPAGGTAHTVWGTEIYTDDSSICTAALHAGRIDLQSGGHVVYYTLPGREIYFGTSRHGVDSADYAQYAGSFAFDRTPQEPVPNAPPGTRLANSVMNAVSLRGTHNPVRFFCPPDLVARTVWGSGPYTDDSSICTAAVHAGRIEQATGGPVTIVPAAGRGHYQGSTAHGITTVDYGRFEGSFSFAP